MFEDLYRRLNRRRYVHPDPLEFLYAHDDPSDREIVGLVASSLAYGRVAQILRDVSMVLERMPKPARFVRDAAPSGVKAAFAGFKHRFTTGDELADMLLSARRVLRSYGSLEACFASAARGAGDTVLPALSAFAGELNAARSPAKNTLIPSPDSGGACKRLNLFLRWMVRSDDVDPGGWTSVPPSRLIVPLDTHMHRLGRALGLTARNQADMRTALEVTRAFRSIAPDDPVRYDFSLTRLGIRPDCGADEFLDACRLCEAR